MLSSTQQNEIQIGAQNCKLDMVEVFAAKKIEPAEVVLSLADKFARELDIDDTCQYGYLLAIAEYIVMNQRAYFCDSDWNPLSLVSKSPELQKLSTFLYKQTQKKSEENKPPGISCEDV